METKEIETMRIEKAVEKINDLINPASFAVRVIITGDIVAIFRYRTVAERWLEKYTANGALEIVRIDLAGCDLLLNIKH